VLLGWGGLPHPLRQELPRALCPRSHSTLINSSSSSRLGLVAQPHTTALGLRYPRALVHLPHQPPTPTHSSSSTLQEHNKSLHHTCTNSSTTSISSNQSMASSSWAAHPHTPHSSSMTPVAGAGQSQQQCSTAQRVEAMLLVVLVLTLCMAGGARAVRL
jgi:hypothetical protein